MTRTVFLTILLATIATIVVTFRIAPLTPTDILVMVCIGGVAGYSVASSKREEVYDDAEVNFILRFMVMLTGYRLIVVLGVLWNLISLRMGD